MITKDLIKILNKRYPKSIAKKYHDYIGLMCSKLPKEVNKILICLDYDEEVYQVALKSKPDIIFTHHPFIYGKRYDVLKNDIFKAKLFYDTEALNIPVYSLHINFDDANDGMNDALAKELGLEDIYTPDSCPSMRIGFIKDGIEINEFAKQAKEKLDVPYGLLINEGVKTIKKVGIIGGGGSSYYKYALKEGCDLYISGDVSHNRRRDMVRYHVNYLDLPHEIEKIFIKTFKRILLDIDPSLEITLVDHEKCPKVI